MKTREEKGMVTLTAENVADLEELRRIARAAKMNVTLGGAVRTLTYSKPANAESGHRS